MKPLAAVALVAVAALAAASCTKSEPQSEGHDRKTDVQTGPPRTWPADAPDPQAACNVHTDCAVMTWGAPRPPDPCCDAPVGFWPVSRAYAEWTRGYKEQHCAGVTCKALPLPGPEPMCCASIGRCVNHKCISGCEDPTLDAPKVVWLETACRTMPQ